MNVVWIQNLKVMRRFFLIVVMLCGLLPLLAFSTYYAPSAHADLYCAQIDKGVTCNQFPDEAGDSIWCAGYYYGSGPNTLNSYMQPCIRSLIFSGTGDGKRYAVFNQQVTQSPDVNNDIWDFNSPSADSSGAGTHSTMETRLWSTNTRTRVAGSDQENYVGMDQKNSCDANGGSTNLSLSAPLGGGSFSWSQSDPLFYGCTYVVPSDPWSEFYDYTLEQNDQALTQLTTDFTFSQWEANYGAQTGGRFYIGFSAKSQFCKADDCAFTPGAIGTGNLQDIYAY